MIRPVPAAFHFPHGTVLHYDAEWRLWKAGTASLRIDAAGTEERVTAKGLHQRQTNSHFHQVRRKAVLDERNLRTGQIKHTEQDTPGCVTDVLSGMYYLASLQLEPGRASMFPLNDGGQTVNVRAVAEAREEIKTDAGTYQTVRILLSADAGELKNRGKVWIWYSDDSSHTMVQVRTRLFWGTLNIRLARIDHEPSH
jgi:hypothetical protein